MAAPDCPQCGTRHPEATCREGSRRIETRWLTVCSACYATVRISVPRAQVQDLAHCPLCGTVTILMRSP